jgi:MFS family permease
VFDNRVDWDGSRAARRRGLTLAAMCIAQGMTLLDVTIVNTALPSIQRELHMTAGQLEWAISAYALSLAAFIPLGARHGRDQSGVHLIESIEYPDA